MSRRADQGATSRMNALPTSFRDIQRVRLIWRRLSDAAYTPGRATRRLIDKSTEDAFRLHTERFYVLPPEAFGIRFGTGVISWDGGARLRRCHSQHADEIVPMFCDVGWRWRSACGGERVSHMQGAQSTLSAHGVEVS